MKSLKQLFQENPLTFIISVLTLVSMLGGTAWGMEKRWNQAQAVSGVQQQLLRDEVQRLDDEIFKYEFLEQQNKATALDKAMKKRLEKRMEDKKEELQQLQQK